MQPLQAGDPERIGRFVLQGRLGSGGMGRVYLGTSAAGERAAIKVIRDELTDDPGFRQRFRREVAAASAVAGLFTARVLDADPDAAHPWLATEYVAGPTLQAAVRGDGPLTEPLQRRLALELAEALSAIHAAGLVHRDFKPANVLLAAGGAKVIDFGIAQSLDSTRLTTTGVLVGTPDYMAPEQVMDPAGSGPAADVFALGATLAFAAIGRSPFATEQPASTLYRIVNLEPDLVGVPAGTAAIARACLAKDPAQRPQPALLAAQLRGGHQPTAAGFAAPGATGLHSTGPALRPASPTQSGGYPPVTPPPPTPPPPTRPARTGRGWLAALAALMVIGIAVGVAAFVRTTGSALPPTSSPTPTSAATTDVQTIGADASPQVRYVDRLCASGELLKSLGNTATAPQPTSDPEVARRDFLTTVDRTIGVVDAALADFTVLRDDAPTPEIGQQFGLVVNEFAAARKSFGTARDGIAASNPLTVRSYSTGVQRFSDGVRNIAFAAQLIETIKLPADYTAASASAPRCAR